MQRGRTKMDAEVECQSTTATKAAKAREEKSASNAGGLTLKEKRCGGEA